MNSLELKTNSRYIKIGGKTYQMDFDMEALSRAEQTYLLQYGRDVNVRDIIRELIQVKNSAVMVMAYSALTSAGNKLTWKEFSKEIFTYDNFDTVFDEVISAVSEMMASPDKNAVPEGDGKN